MKILAIDQATHISGFSFWEDNVLCDFGHFEATSKDTVFRMREVSEWVSGLIDVNKPDAIVIEAVQYQQNQKVYSTLSQLQGVLFALFFTKGLEFYIVEPSAWKSAAGIKLREKRKEQKKQSIDITTSEYGVFPTEDEADAILMGRYGCSIIHKEI